MVIARSSHHGHPTVIPRSSHGHRTTGAKEHVQFKVTVSFLEVYNENIRDLLSFHDDDKREEGGIVMARGADGYQYVTPDAPSSSPD